MENLIKRASNRLTPPAYKLTVNGIEAGSVLAGRLISVTLTSSSGETSDQLSLTIDAKPDFEGKPVKLPEADSKSKIELWLGYQLRLVTMGIFYIDKVSISGSSGGSIVTVSAVPKSMNNQTTTHWVGKKIGDIVSKIAKQHGLEERIDLELKSKEIQNILQNKESDLNFLTHLANEYDAIVKPIADKLIFLKKGQGSSASGLPLQPIHLYPHDVIQWNYNKGKRQEKYTQVQTSYWNYKEAQQEIVLAGDKGVLFIIDKNFNDKKSAINAGEAKLKAILRKGNTLSLTVLGDPELTAEGIIKLKGLHTEIDGDWHIKSATHTYSTSGYQCQLEAYTKFT